MGESAPKKFNELQVGEKDPSGQVITRIWAATSSYVIWETTTSSVSYQCGATPAVNAFVVGYLVKSNRIDRLCNSGVKKKYHVNNQLAMALASGLDGHEEQAFKALDDLERQIRNYLETSGRTHYLVTSTILLVLTGMVWVVSLSLSSFSDLQFFQAGQSFENYQIQIKMVLLGGLGGWLSLLQGYRSLDTQGEDSFVVNFALASARILTAMICGLVSYWMIEADLFLGIIQKSPAGYNVIAVLAGFSERMVPNLLNRLGQKVEGSEKPGPNETDSLANNPAPEAQPSEENKPT